MLQFGTVLVYSSLHDSFTMPLKNVSFRVGEMLHGCQDISGSYLYDAL